ncbi:hypothetical protein ACKC9G_03575 [Pokkaliibacter sp. CJK22405]|uniref:hypothetical protein n=1 Tax=Pokkaliibacter sp. CJK22405 TaxID=3384615 RepID=UPI003984E623
MIRRQILVCSVAALLLAGCSDHDLPYYQSHLDEAKAKQEECEASMKSAFMSQDEDKLKSVVEDKECIAADKANREYRYAQAELAAKKRQEEAAKKEAEAQRQYDEEYAKAKESLSAASTEEFFKSGEDCTPKMWGKPSAACKAYNELEEGKLNTALSALITQFPKDKLKAQSEDRCSGINFDKTACDLLRKAVTKQQKDQVAFYLENRESLRTDFNDCVNRIKSLNKDQKYNDANEFARSYQCSMAQRAAQELKVFGFNKTI